MDALYVLYNDVINSLSNFLYTYILIILLVAGGIYFTIRTRFVQFRYLLESIRVVMQPSPDQANVSAFQTLMVSTASRVGTGNIAGISTAICIGGMGAVFWMWVTALLGSATAFIEGTLAQIYKKRAPDGSCYGGPAYYIEQTLKKRWLGVLFASMIPPSPPSSWAWRWPPCSCCASAAAVSRSPRSPPSWSRPWAFCI